MVQSTPSPVTRADRRLAVVSLGFLLSVLICVTPLAAEQPQTVTLEQLHLDQSPSGLALANIGPQPTGVRTITPFAADDPAILRLRSLAANGNVSGLDGVLYDNRDRDHSTIPRARFPQLTFLEYDEQLQPRGLDYGLAKVLFPSFITIGNSSTAYRSGAFSRSLPRAAMTGFQPLVTAVAPFYNNALYVYPEHEDHDQNDLFPANWPYTVISQGSSGSDKPFLDALLLTLAALPPETRQRLQDERLIAPALQMILRYGMDNVLSSEHYRSGSAHPTVFNANQLNPVAMILRANALQADAIPPMPRIDVIEETFLDQAGLLGRSEKLFDTPAAIARVWRDHAGRKRVVLSAASTHDPNDRNLRFDWVLLRGDPRSVTIETLDDTGAVVEVFMDWHNPGSTNGPNGKASARIDIGLIVSNGVNDSAPAFFSVLFPHFQQRTYDLDAAGVPRLLAIDYRNANQALSFDPLLHWSAPWRDTFLYDEQGNLTAWTRAVDNNELRLGSAGDLMPQPGTILEFTGPD